MKILGNQKFLQVVGCLLCFAVVWIRMDTLGASEFSGGRITGFILVMAKDGSYLFLFAILLTFGYPRIAATVALAASVVSFPLYLYFVAPGLFRWLFRGEYKVFPHARLVWNEWALTGLITLALAGYVFLRSFSAHERKNLSERV